MTKQRVPTKNSKYYVPTETYLTAYHYCRQYPLWSEIRDIVSDTRKSPKITRDQFFFSGIEDPTGTAATRRADISRKMKLIEETAEEAGGPLFKPWIIRGTCYDETYIQLQARGIPCGKNLYYTMRKRFYYLLANRI